MKIVRLLVREFIGMFVDDGSLALLVTVLIASLSAAVAVQLVSPLIGSAALFAGCIAILWDSVNRAAKKR